MFYIPTNNFTTHQSHLYLPSMYNYKIKDIAEQTGLKELFVRRCIREMKDFFEPHIERGVKNSLVLDSNIMPIFDKIKQDKEKGISLSTIKKNLLNSNDLQSEGIVKVLQKDTKTEYKTTSSSDDSNEWLSIKDAAYLSKKSEATVRRLINKLKNTDVSSIKKDKDRWLVKRHIVLKHFDVNDQANLRTHIANHDNALHTRMPNHDNELHRHMDNHEDNLLTHNKQSAKEVIDLLKNQVNELKEQLKQKDAQLEKQTTDFKEQLCKKDTQLNNLLSKKDEQLNQKDQQIHQLHVLLKESKTNTIDYKPDENLGVFSKVLVKFGL